MHRRVGRSVEKEGAAYIIAGMARLPALVEGSNRAEQNLKHLVFLQTARNSSVGWWRCKVGPLT